MRLLLLIDVISNLASQSFTSHTAAVQLRETVPPTRPRHWQETLASRFGIDNDIDLQSSTSSPVMVGLYRRRCPLDHCYCPNAYCASTSSLWELTVGFW
jgi:hypothetical protein